MNVEAISPRYLAIMLPAVADPSGTRTFYLGGLNDYDHEQGINAKHQVLGAEFNTVNTQTAGTVEKWHIYLQKNDGSATIIAALSTDTGVAKTWTASDGTAQTTGAGTAITAGTPKLFHFTTCINDTILDKDDTLQLVFADTSNGASASTTFTAGAVVKIAYAYGKVR